MLNTLCYGIIALLLSACAMTTAQNATAVSGKVSVHTHAQSGVQVYAWPTSTRSLSGEAPYRSSRSDSDGSYTLRIPEGEYYILARGGNYFAYYGRNPITVPPQGLTDLKIGLVPLPDPPAIHEITIENGIAGKIVVDGSPLAGAVVYAYTDLSSRLKGMGYAVSSPSDAQGNYELSLPSGTYYLIARMRKEEGMLMGPLRAGDFIGYAPINPIKVLEGRVSLVSIPMLVVPEKIDLLAANLFGKTSLRGRILNKEGKTVAGARAILYGEPQMLNRPLFVSQPTNSDGTFILSFPSGGTYYLAARQQLGGAPAPGELYGTYDGTPDHSVKIETGEQRTGVDLVVEEMW